MKKYFVAKQATSSGFIGRMSLNDIATQLSEKKISENFIATEITDWSYDDLIAKPDVQWETVSQLLERMRLQKSQPSEPDFRKYIAVGAGVGLFIGFLLRPSVALVGQLPFTAVITRGAMLQGLDQMLVPAAQTSFNYMLVGGIVGVVAGFLATKIMSPK